MSKMKSTLAATFLTVVLAVPASAGVIGGPAGTLPPPPPSSDGGANPGSPGPQAPGDSELSPTELIDILTAVLSLF